MEQQNAGQDDEDFPLSSPKPDSDELDGPFSSGFLNAPAAVNNSVRFSVSDRKTETV